MQHHFAAIFSRRGAENVRVSAMGNALVHLETGLNSMRSAAAPLISRQKKVPLDAVRASLEVSIPIDAVSKLGTVPLEFGAVDPTRPRFDLNPDLSALFWRFTARVLHEAAAGRGEVLSASGADAFVGAAHAVSKADCMMALSHRRDTRDWIRDVDVVGVAPGLERYAEARRRYVRTESEVVGQVVVVTLDPLSFTLKTVDGNTRVLATQKHEKLLHSMWGKHVVATVSARINREGHIADAHLIDAQPVRTTRNLSALFERTRGAGGDLWTSDEAREYLNSLREEPGGN